ncbi:MAG TPA: DUF3341 domain-containing protein [Dongiaceae bacterium]|jgi:hypothetical protein
MSEMLLVEVSSPQAALQAAELAAAGGNPPIDVLSPQPIKGVDEHLAPAGRQVSVGWIMFIAAICGALFGYAIQWYSAVIDYPILSGGRPLNAWQVFLIVPYEAAILFAAVSGFVAWLWLCRLPKLHHPLFDLRLVERVTSDRYLLIFTGSDKALEAVTRDLAVLKPRFHRPPS